LNNVICILIYIDNIIGGCAESIAYKLHSKGYQVSAYLDRKPSSPSLGIIIHHSKSSSPPPPPSSSS
jgi:hypothetical protein